MVVRVSPICRRVTSKNIWQPSVSDFPLSIASFPVVFDIHTWAGLDSFCREAISVSVSRSPASLRKEISLGAVRRERKKVVIRQSKVERAWRMPENLPFQDLDEPFLLSSLCGFVRVAGDARFYPPEAAQFLNDSFTVVNAKRKLTNNSDTGNKGCRTV